MVSRKVRTEHKFDMSKKDSVQVSTVQFECRGVEKENVAIHFYKSKRRWDDEDIATTFNIQH